MLCVQSSEMLDGYCVVSSIKSKWDSHAGSIGLVESRDLILKLKMPEAVANTDICNLVRSSKLSLHPKHVSHCTERIWGLRSQVSSGEGRIILYFLYFNG